jgi:hypothetical protein
MPIFWGYCTRKVKEACLSARTLLAAKSVRAAALQISISPSFVPRGKFIRIAHCQTVLEQWDDINSSKL